MKRKSIVALVTLYAVVLTCVFVPGSLAQRVDNSGNDQNRASNSSTTRFLTPQGSTDPRQILGAKLGVGPGSRTSAGEAAGGGDVVHPESGEPRNLRSNIPLSAAISTTVGGRNTHLNNVSVFGDLDGKEDLSADHGALQADLSGDATLPDDYSLTRVAISEHTIANGFNENIFYYGDSIGNLYVDASPFIPNFGAPPPPNRFVINLPTALNAFGNLSSDSQIVITGLAVNPVSDLTAYANVNGSYAPYAGLTGEVLFVTYTDTGGGLRLVPNGQLVRSGVLAYPIADVTSAAPAPPGIVSPAGFPVQMGGAFGVVFSIFSNLAGIAVDDDGNAYFQQVDLQAFTGANIVKISDIGTNQDRSAATSGFPTLTTLNPTNGNYGTASGPAPQVNRFTNYSGTNTFFGNIAALAAGPGNVLYAAVSRSFVSTDDAATQNTEGLFANPAALGPTPAMVISFSDVAGAFDVCSGEASSSAGPTNVGGVLPIADGFADPVAAGTAIRWRVYVLGTGPDPRLNAVPNPAVFGTATNTQKVDFQVDFSVYSGLTVDEGGKLYVVSGGTPAGVGLNPSPRIGEILCFEDVTNVDRRADYLDQRGAATFPNPPDSGTNTGDGADTRTDHIYWMAPLDIVSATPSGVAGLTRGFLRYTNRLAPNAISAGITLGQTAGQTVQGDDDTTGPIIFENLDPSHQVAGGDDQTSPFRGDDSDGGGNLPIPGPFNGGFEFSFGAPGTAAWNQFFLNSNGSVSFNIGDTSNSPSVPDFRAGSTKIAPAWADLNPFSRLAGNLRTFPVQAMGFAGINQFKVRFIGVPQFGHEPCGSQNTFAANLFDDGIGVDENSTQPLNPANPIGNNAVPFDLQEGPQNNRFTVEPNTGAIVPFSPRRQGSGYITFEYGRMDLLGTRDEPVLAGYSVGSLDPLNPPGICEMNLSLGARDAYAGLFGNLQGQTAVVDAGRIGEGTEPTIFEFFDSGASARIGNQGEIFLAVPEFDLRFEGADPDTTKPPSQPDANQGSVGLFGTTGVSPGNPIISQVIPGTFAPTPTSTGLVNAIGGVELNLVGSFFFPNEVTTVCGTGVTGDIPTPRPGKTVTAAVTFALDANGDGIPEATVALTNVTVINRNLVRGTLAPLASLPGTPFPLPACGGVGTATLTHTFSAGDNNNLGAFTRTAVGTLDTGRRAPVVLSVTPVEGNCSLQQDVVIAGGCFASFFGNATQVFAVEEGNTANVIQATTVNVLDNNTISANFNLGAAANIGKMFRIFVRGPGIPAPPGPAAPGFVSRNLSALPPGAPATAPLGNEAGNVVKFTCLDTVAPVLTCPANITSAAGTGQSSKVVSYSTPIGTDNLPGVTTSCSPASGSSFPVGTTMVNCTATDAAGNSSSCQFAVNVTAPNALQFSSESYAVVEGYSIAFVTITRSDPADSVSVDYGTVDGTASQKSDYTMAAGRLTFAPGETSKTIAVYINDDGFVEGPETLNIVLSHPTANAVIATPARVITIGDNDSVPMASNPIDDAQNFVRQQYHDFLNRDPDAGGLGYWSDQIASCGSNVTCINSRRVGVSAAFFAEPEFQTTGFYVYLVHKALAGTNPTYDAFMYDRSRVVVGPQLDASKAAYATECLGLPEFGGLASMDNPHYIDALNANTGNSLTTAQRDQLVAALNAGTQTRAEVLRSIAENEAFKQREYNGAFVLMQYFGYLRRGPDQGGYDFWLDVLNNHVPGNFKSMVCAFVTSNEYQDRFGGVRSHSNADCASVDP
jgi:hypothetical protein